MTKPTLYVTNWSSPKLHGPGKRYSVMALPRAWERGDGTVTHFVPPVKLLREVQSGAVTEGYYFLELRRLWTQHIESERVCWEGSHNELPHPHVPGRLYAATVPSPLARGGPVFVEDGDTLLCACARARPCHRREAARFLLAAGWRVVLDGVEVIHF